MSDELRLGRERRFLVLLGIICLALIGGALYMQVVLGEAPCPLCILQRYALLLIALFAFIGAAMRTKGALTFFEGLVVLSALGGVAAAGHHVYTQFFPQVSCGVDVLQPIVDDLPLAKVFPLGFQVDGFAAHRIRRCWACRWRNGRWWRSCSRWSWCRWASIAIASARPDPFAQTPRSLYKEGRGVFACAGFVNRA